MKRFLKILGICFVIVILFFVGMYIYLEKVNNAHVDTRYRFSILNQRGWQLLESPNQVYYSLATKGKNGEVISTFNLMPVQMKFINSNEIYGNFSQNCIKNSEMYENAQKPEVTPVKINNLTGWVCSYDGDAFLFTGKIGSISIFIDYVLFKNPKQNVVFLLSFSYPKDNQSELQKVNQLLDTFIVN